VIIILIINGSVGGVPVSYPQICLRKSIFYLFFLPVTLAGSKIDGSTFCSLINWLFHGKTQGSNMNNSLDTSKNKKELFRSFVTVRFATLISFA
jgi:hypothetical protein